MTARQQRTNGNYLKVLSLYWGFYGGLAKYAHSFDAVASVAPIEVQNVCILRRGTLQDRSALKTLSSVHEIPIRTIADISWVQRVRELINQFAPDLIVSHVCNGHAAAVIARAFVKDQIPILCTFHGQHQAGTAAGAPAALLFNLATLLFIRNFAEFTLTVSEWSKRLLIQRGIDDSRITVIHNGIEIHDERHRHCDDIRREWGIGQTETIIGVTSRLHRAKGLTYLIDAFGRLASKREGLRLVIVGDGGWLNALEKQATEAGIREKVVFSGFRSDIDDCLAAFDVFAFPTLNENHSLALLEAMRAGKAIVATDVGANTESLRHGREALIVPPANVESLVEALDRLLLDPGLRNTLALAARERFESEFSVDRMLRQTAEWLMACGTMAGGEHAWLPAGRCQSP